MQWSRNRALLAISLLGAAATTGAALWFWSSGALRSRDGARAAASEALARHCLDCHNDIEQSGDFVIEPNALADVGQHPDIWEKVLSKVSARSMPPPDGPKPDDATYSLLERVLETELDAHYALRLNPGPLPLLRRLTRTEYGNAIRDLLALDSLPAELDLELLLPADNASSGFDNIAELLFVSPSIFDRYIDTAIKLSRLAVGDMSAPALVNRHRLSLQSPQDKHVPGLPIGTRGGLLFDTYFPLDGDYVFTIEFAGRADGSHAVEILVDGERRALVTVTGTDEPRTPPATARIHARAGPAQIGVTFIEGTEAFDESTLRVRRRSRGALVAIEHATIAGPYDATGPGTTPSRQRILTCTPENAASERECAREILAKLARRAYRRPVTDADLGALLQFYDAGAAGQSFERGIQRALERLLVSPQFLYRIEQVPADAVPGTAFPISDVELASRLSFFLWSSIPDDELLALAEEGRLRDPGVLSVQVERLLADPRADTLVSNFAAQWLFARDIAVQDADLYLFRNYDDTLKSAFAQELELFVGSIFRERRSVLELFTAQHTFVNERLAEHYGIPHVVGSHFRRVELPENSPRLGLLGKGGLLTVTSYSNRTSPVLRGKYVLENLLATPPPPPPPDVPSLVTEEGGGGATLPMRRALERHRADPACASCHAEMDVIGFALENFDAIGQWRSQDAGALVDAVGELPDGTRVQGVAGLRDYLLRRPERLVGAFTEKMLMYALGRNVQYYDAPAIRAIVRRAAEDGYSVAAIAHGIVASTPFQMRVVEAE